MHARAAARGAQTRCTKDSRSSRTERCALQECFVASRGRSVQSKIDASSLISPFGARGPARGSYIEARRSALFDNYSYRCDETGRNGHRNIGSHESAA